MCYIKVLSIVLNADILLKVARARASSNGAGPNQCRLVARFQTAVRIHPFEISLWFSALVQLVSILMSAAQPALLALLRLGNNSS